MLLVVLNHINIINPVGFTAEVLNYSGDYELADTILVEAGIKSEG